ncbi:hypothetical protein ZIOFF_065056 [Zingiber officinale]|uniref:Uncharacterized protein n=1 Tax=Zingiber officinale TaxID=94328 RepID=A0A8J5EZI6_ZINOF|nr:hypothetical protein ZIOFF_065056 [Zingiber officinale]
MEEAVTKDFGRIDILVHSLANGPEVTKPLLETSRRGYLATISASSYSFVSLLRHFLPIMNPVLASTCRYGGGMSSAKAALESDTKVLAFELHLLATKHQMNYVLSGRMYVAIKLKAGWKCIRNVIVLNWKLINGAPVVSCYAENSRKLLSEMKEEIVRFLRLITHRVGSMHSDSGNEFWAQEHVTPMNPESDE